jgi:hypothetical protein
MGFHKGLMGFNGILWHIMAYNGISWDIMGYMLMDMANELT